MLRRTRYDLTDAPTRAERMECITDEDFDRYFDLYCLYHDAQVTALTQIMANAREHGCVLIDVPHNERRAYVSPSFVHEGGLRITFFDNIGPTGHYELTDVDDNVRLLPDDIFDVCYKL